MLNRWAQYTLGQRWKKKCWRGFQLSIKRSHSEKRSGPGTAASCANTNRRTGERVKEGRLFHWSDINWKSKSSSLIWKNRWKNDMPVPGWAGCHWREMKNGAGTQVGVPICITRSNGCLFWWRSQKICCYPLLHTWKWEGGRSCAKAFGRYKTQCIRCATTKFSAWYLFCSYKMQNTTFSDSENKSKSAPQNPMHLKLKK